MAPYTLWLAKIVSLSITILESIASAATLCLLLCACQKRADPAPVPITKALPAKSANVLFRTLAVPHREHLYNEIPHSVVIDSQAALESFLEFLPKPTDIPKHHHDPGWARVRKEISDQRIDFSFQRLVVLKHVEGSGSIRVQFGAPSLEDDAVVFPVESTSPTAVTADMAYYAHVGVLDDHLKSQLVVRTRGRNETLQAWGSQCPTEKTGPPTKIWAIYNSTRGQ